VDRLPPLIQYIQCGPARTVAALFQLADDTMAALSRLCMTRPFQTGVVLMVGSVDHTDAPEAKFPLCARSKDQARGPGTMELKPRVAKFISSNAPRASGGRPYRRLRRGGPCRPRARNLQDQHEAIDWANRHGHTPLVAVRHLNDKKKPDHWRSA